ncbi:hypothetical protein, partial [Aliivibrio fischeri]|uniref:hypothetical protein n=1 Tax=Aliivibrio fischeri TaxID=668 RepID=UPI0005511593
QTCYAGVMFLSISVVIQCDMYRICNSLRMYGIELNSVLSTVPLGLLLLKLSGFKKVAKV